MPVPQPLSRGLLLASVSVLLLDPMSRAAEPLSKEQLLQNWKQLEQWDRTQRTYRVATDARDIPGREPSVMVVKVRPDRWLTSQDYQGKGSVFASSPRYQFLLWHEKDKPWAIREFTTETSGPTARDFEASARGTSAAPFSVFNLGLGMRVTPAGLRPTAYPTLTELTQLPSFKLNGITAEPGGIDRVAFEFDQASVVLFTERARSSRMVRAEVVGKVPPAPRAWRFDVLPIELYPETSANGVPRCKRIEYIGRAGPDMQVSGHVVMSFTDYKDEETPDKEFTLSHYGLPEAEGVPPLPTRTPNYVWFLVGAAAFGILAVGLRFVARRRANRVGVNP